MTIERFSKREFEAALPVDKKSGEILWRSVGLEFGEETYHIRVHEGVVIRVRSSVRADGLAAEASKDSIRCWLAAESDRKPLGSKVQAYVTRVTGWQDRMTKVLKELWKRSLEAGDCPVCGKPLCIYKVKKDGKNKGRLFAKCWDHGNAFRWLDEKTPEGYGKCRYEKQEAVDEGTVREHLDQLQYKKDKVRLLRDLVAASKGGCLWALGRIFAEQTSDEQANEVTRHYNKVGFSGVDAEILSSFAKQYEKRGSLSDKQILLAMKKMPKYAGQLVKLLAT